MQRGSWEYRGGKYWYHHLERKGRRIHLMSLLDTLPGTFRSHVCPTLFNFVFVCKIFPMSLLLLVQRAL